MKHHPGGSHSGRARPDAKISAERVDRGPEGLIRNSGIWNGVLKHWAKKKRRERDRKEAQL